MTALPDLWLVLKIMFFSTIGTAGILLPFMAIPITLILAIRHTRKSKERKGE